MVCDLFTLLRLTYTVVVSSSQNRTDVSYFWVHSALGELMLGKYPHSVEGTYRSIKGLCLAQELWFLVFFWEGEGCLKIEVNSATLKYIVKWLHLMNACRPASIDRHKISQSQLQVILPPGALLRPSPWTAARSSLFVTRSPTLHGPAFEIKLGQALCDKFKSRRCERAEALHAVLAGKRKEAF